MTDTKPNLFQRIQAVMREVAYIEKGSRNNHQGYSYTGHDTLTAILHPLYVKHGIVRSARMLSGTLNAGQCFVAECEITWVNVDDPADRHSVTLTTLAPSTSKTPQPAATMPGVALSYAVKTAEFKLFSLTGDDTPDAGSEEQTRGEERAQRQAVDVDKLCGMFDRAKTEADMQAAKDAANAALRSMTASEKERVKVARDKALERMGWQPR